MKKKFIILIIILCLFKYIHANNSGIDFWLCFPQNYTRMAANIIYIISDYNTSGTITAYGVPSTTYFSITAGSYTTITLPISAAAHGNDTITNTGIHIESEHPILVYCLSKYTDSTDGFLALPVNGLGTHYIVLCYSGRNLDNVYYDSQIAIAAAEDNTTVHIDCPVNPGARPAPYDIVLNKGQVYQLCDIYSSKQDLTGTIISSDKPVAVFGGHRCAKVPVDYMAADFLVEQLPPTNSWSTRYLTVPLAGRDIADTYRIIAAEDNTQVTVNATPIPTLNKGQAVQFLSGIPQQIISDKPIFVAQFANGLTFDYKTGDPFMMNITATDQYINNSKVVIPTGYSYNYLTIIAPNSAIGSITLNGSIINPSIFSTIITSGFSSARISISPGLHTITSPFNFGIWAYGFREYESYGFQGGTGINLYTSTITPTITPTRTITSTCTITSSRTITRTFTTTWTSSSTQTITPTRTESPTFTVTRTITPTQTYSFTRTLTLTRTYTFTGTNTLTTTNTISPTISQTIILKNTYTLSHTIIPSETWVTNSPTFNFTYTCSETLTPVITLASTFSKTPTTTLTFTHTFSITLTPSFTITNSSSFTNTVSLSPTISPTFTLTSTMTNTKTITMTVTMNLNKPLVLELKGNFPEQDKINIIFFLSKEAKVNIKIFTVSGEIVLDKKIYGNSGYNCFFWDGLNNKKRKVASGVYIYKITAELKDEKQSIMNKLFIIK